MTLRKAAQQALEALEEQYSGPLRDKAMDALRAALESDDTEMLLRQHRFENGRLRAALAEPAEPVAWYDSLSGDTDFTSYKPHRKPSSPSAEWIPLYTAPTPRKPEQEPWATREMFYEHIDRAVENLRQRMMIRSVTMRCKDFDVALPIIDAMEGHVLVGAAPTPRKPLTDEEIAKCNEKVPVLRHITLGYLIKFARAIEAAHGITGDSK